MIFLNSLQFSGKKRGKRGGILVLAGCIVLVLLGAVLLFGGIALLAYNMGTDADGYSQSSIYEVRSSTYAFALWVGSSRFPSYLTWMSPKDIGQAMWTVTSVESYKDLFVGWAEASDGENYLRDVMFETPPIWHWYVEAYYAGIEIPDSLNQNYGGEPTNPPSEETFWIESVQSTKATKITWDAFWEPLDNRKILIIMNSDGTTNVNADIQLGFKVPIFGWLPFVFIPLGVLLCLVGVYVVRRKNLLKLLKRNKNENVPKS